MGKLKNQFTINLDDDAAQALQYIARIQQRKPAELLRLLAEPIIYKELAKVCNLGGSCEVAHFTPSLFDQLPKLETK